MRLWQSNGRKGHVGIELGTASVAVARLARGGDAADAGFEYRVPEGDDSAPTLRTLVHEHRLQGTPCTAVLPQGSYQLLQVETPSVPKAEQRDAVRWRIRDRIDYPLDEAVVDVFDPPAGANRRGNSLNAVVCPAATVAAQVAAIRDAGLELESIDIVELAQRNLLERLGDVDAGAALLTLRENNGLITLVRGDELYLARDLDTGTSALSDGDAVFDALVLELQRSLDYYESSFGMPPVTRLLIHPCEPVVERLAEHLRTTLPGLQASIFDMAALNTATAELPAGCLNALGAALGAAKRVAGDA